MTTETQKLNDLVVSQCFQILELQNKLISLETKHSHIKEMFTGIIHSARVVRSKLQDNDSSVSVEDLASYLGQELDRIDRARERNDGEFC